jgi:putative transposase
MPRGANVTAERAIRLLQQVSLLQGAGKSVPEACREVGVGASTYYRWRERYAGRTVDEAVRIKETQRENAMLRRLVAEQALKIAALEDVVRGKP